MAIARWIFYVALHVHGRIYVLAPTVKEIRLATRKYLLSLSYTEFFSARCRTTFFCGHHFFLWPPLFFVATTFFCGHHFFFVATTFFLWPPLYCRRLPLPPSLSIDGDPSHRRHHGARNITPPSCFSLTTDEATGVYLSLLPSSVIRRRRQVGCGRIPILI